MNDHGFGLVSREEVYDLMHQLLSPDKGESMNWWPSLAEMDHPDQRIRSHP